MKDFFISIKIRILQHIRNYQIRKWVRQNIKYLAVNDIKLFKNINVNDRKQVVKILSFMLEQHKNNHKGLNIIEKLFFVRDLGYDHCTGFCSSLAFIRLDKRFYAYVEQEIYQILTHFCPKYQTDGESYFPRIGNYYVQHIKPIDEHENYLFNSYLHKSSYWFSLWDQAIRVEILEFLSLKAILELYTAEEIESGEVDGVTLKTY
jgi:hypothetical protein